MPRGRQAGRRGYAPRPALLATVLLAGLALAACGTRTAAMVEPPPATNRALTAPPAAPVSGATTEPPSFGVTVTAAVVTATAPTLMVTAVPAAPTRAAAPTTPVAPRPPASPVAPTSAAPAPAGVRIVPALIPYPATRQAEMAAYSLRHSGSDTARLDPTVIVLHYTAGGTWSSTRSSFASDTPNLGELPNVCAHFIVDQDGTVYQLVPTSIRCRHTIGLNDVAIGIEMVQAAGSGSTWADQQILGRPAQVGAALALVRSLQAQYGIGTSDVIGHAMANAAPQFHDLLGWRNDHTDWLAADVAEFRARL